MKIIYLLLLQSIEWKIEYLLMCILYVVLSLQSKPVESRWVTEVDDEINFL